MHFHHNPTQRCAIKIKTIIGERHRKPRATVPWLFWAWLVCIRSLQWCQITSRFKSYFVGWYWWIWCIFFLRHPLYRDSPRCSSHTKNRAWHWYQPVLDGFGITAFFQTSDHSWIRLLLHFGGNRWVQPFTLTQIYHNGGIAMWNPVLPNGSKMFKMIFIMIFKNDSGKIMWFIIIPI